MQPVALISFRGEEASRQPPDTDATALLLRLELGPADLASRGSNSRMQIHLFSRLTCLCVSLCPYTPGSGTWWMIMIYLGWMQMWFSQYSKKVIGNPRRFELKHVDVVDRFRGWISGGRNRIEFKIYFEYYWGVILQESRSLEGGWSIARVFVNRLKSGLNRCEYVEYVEVFEE